MMSFWPYDASYKKLDRRVYVPLESLPKLALPADVPYGAVARAFALGSGTYLWVKLLKLNRGNIINNTS